jgi:hypothetical protein
MNKRKESIDMINNVEITDEYINKIGRKIKTPVIDQMDILYKMSNECHKLEKEKNKGKE